MADSVGMLLVTPVMRSVVASRSPSGWGSYDSLGGNVTTVNQKWLMERTSSTKLEKSTGLVM